MKGYEALYGYEDEVPHYHSGIKLDYPDITHYWLTYGTPENPNAGKEALLRDIRAQSMETVGATPGFFESGSVGLFQQLPASSWGSR